MKRIIGLFITLVTVLSLFRITTAQAASINIGDYVVMGKYYDEPILWRCVDIDENGPLMLSDKIISIKPYDAGGYNTANDSSHGRTYDDGYYRKNVGSNFWEDSNIRSWLNSTASAGEIVWLCGNPPTNGNVWRGYNDYADEKGFLADGNFTSSERKAIKTVTQKSLLSGYEYSSTINPDYHEYNDKISSVVQNYADAYSLQVTDKVFLLDVKQVNMVYENRGILGANYHIGQLTQEAVDNSEYKGSGLAVGENWYYWLRSPYAEFNLGYSVRYINTDGNVYCYYATDYALGVRPAFYINLSSVIHTPGSGSVGDPYRISEGSIDEEVSAELSEMNYINGVLTATVNYNYIVTDCYAFLAIYDGNKLIALSNTFSTKDSESADFEINEVLENKEYMVKIFFFNELNSIKPLSQPIVREFDDMEMFLLKY